MRDYLRWFKLAWFGLLVLLLAVMALAAHADAKAPEHATRAEVFARVLEDDINVSFVAAGQTWRAIKVACDPYGKPLRYRCTVAVFDLATGARVCFAGLRLRPNKHVVRKAHIVKCPVIA